MAENASNNPPPSIAALPSTTVRQIGSHLLLTDPSSVVKELIDNALDARAKSIFVDIAANTIDSIQIKDDGHGIPSEDRALTCRRYCTSKIRDFQDLKEVGGKWLGFRGEALASISEMCGTVSITTRVEGEPVAVELTYQRNGELTSTERGSHPVGTTVKVTKLLEFTKVRKALAVKQSTKCLAKIKHLMQAYSLARPAVRFRLHVLKMKNNKGDFVYAPKTNANVEDAALKVIGKECALQCDWTALEWDGLELHAFLPKPTAVGSKVANHGAFISVDSRPVSAARGTFKKIAVAVRDRMRKVNPTLANVNNPFFSMNIICPVESYDPNIEPAKNDVVFENEDSVIAAVDRLLVLYYPQRPSSAESATGLEMDDAPTTQSGPLLDEEAPLSRLHSPPSMIQDVSTEDPVIPAAATQTVQPRWRSSMYGIDVEDLEFLPNDTPILVEEEEGCLDAAISNPWTIARMNAPVKPRKPASVEQLPSPAKSQGDSFTAPRSPTPVATPRQFKPVEPPTPQTAPQADRHESRIGNDSQRSFQVLQRPALPNVDVLNQGLGLRRNRTDDLTLFKDRGSSNNSPSMAQNFIPRSYFVSTSSLPRDTGVRHPPRAKEFLSPMPQSDDTWFGRPMRNAPQTAPPLRRSRRKGTNSLLGDNYFSAQRSLLWPAADHPAEKRLTSKTNTDIRDFLSQSRRTETDIGPFGQSQGMQSQCLTEQLRAYAEQDDVMLGSSRRPQSAGSYQRSTNTAEEMDAVFRFHHNNPSNQKPLQALHPPLSTSSATLPRPQRRRTTDGGLQRTRSSTLPLNFTPHGFETHNLCLLVETSVPRLAHQACDLDMVANSLEWGCDCTDAFDAFASAVSEQRIMGWVVKVDGMLHDMFERVAGVEVRGALHEGIRRFLDLRKEEEEARKLVVADGSIPQDGDGDGIDNDVSRGTDSKMSAPSPSFGHSGQRTDTARTEKNDVNTEATIGIDYAPPVHDPIGSNKWQGDFDVKQFVDMDAGAGRRCSHSAVRDVKAENEFGEDMDYDEMLMDL